MATRLTTGTPSTPLGISVGVIANINDGNPSTVCEVIGANPTFFWFLMDFGAPVRVIQVILAQWYEIGGAPDTGFGVYYSNSPLNSGNTGTRFGAAINASNTPIDSTVTDDQTAQYWGLFRPGGTNWSGFNIGMGDFDIYGLDDPKLSWLPAFPDQHLDTSFETVVSGFIPRAPADPTDPTPN